jgi:hypothetical protein
MHSGRCSKTAFEQHLFPLFLLTFRIVKVGEYFSELFGLSLSPPLLAPKNLPPSLDYASISILYGRRLSL